jgi:ABC-type uncharacterized transport system permease subunit
MSDFEPEPHQTRKLVILLLVVTLASALSVGAVYAVYTITSNHVNVNTSAQATMTLTANATSAVVGDTAHLTATISDASNLQVTFYDGASSIGSVVATGGIATLNVPLSQAKIYDFSASCTHP